MSDEVAGTVYFAKRTNRILGANEEIQGRFDIDEKVDYETELAVIIGKEGKGITEEKAEEYVFGYSVFNDLSSRDLQTRHGQWLIAELSKGITLEAGDIIATGTPAGVGMGFTPPRFLKKGDKVTCEIDRIGQLTNYIV